MKQGERPKQERCPTCYSEFRDIKNQLPHPTEAAHCFDPWHTAGHSTADELKEINKELNELPWNPPLKQERRVMRLPVNQSYPGYDGLHREDDWCRQAGCTPACSSDVEYFNAAAGHSTEEAPKPKVRRCPACQCILGEAAQATAEAPERKHVYGKACWCQEKPEAAPAQPPSAAAQAVSAGATRAARALKEKYWLGAHAAETELSNVAEIIDREMSAGVNGELVEALTRLFAVVEVMNGGFVKSEDYNESIELAEAALAKARKV